MGLMRWMQLNEKMVSTSQKTTALYMRSPPPNELSLLLEIATLLPADICMRRDSQPDSVRYLQPTNRLQAQPLYEAPHCSHPAARHSRHELNSNQPPCRLANSAGTAGIAFLRVRPASVARFLAPAGASTIRRRYLFRLLLAVHMSVASSACPCAVFSVGPWARAAVAPPAQDEGR